MIKGEKVRWVSDGMTGIVVDVWPDGSALQITWAEGFPQEISGGTFWHNKAHVDAGLIARVNGHGPETKVEPVNTFEQAFRLTFEL